MPASQNLIVDDFTIRGRAEPTRKFYGEVVAAAAHRNPRLVCLVADLTNATEIAPFREQWPERFVQVGIAEANMVGIAGGMARMGDIPFIHSFSVFVTRRCYDQIAMQVAYPNLNIKIVGFSPGIAHFLGPSHQAIDDIALMRSLPNMTIIEPADATQLGGAVEAALAHDGPVYLRLSRTEQIPMERVPLLRGKAELRRRGRHGVIVAAGMMVAASEQAADILAEQGFEVSVVNAATIKPLDPMIADLAADAGVVVTAENHSVIGGLGSAVVDLLHAAGVQAGLSMVGVRDTFAEGGSLPYLAEKYGLSPRDIVRAFNEARQKKTNHPRS